MTNVESGVTGKAMGRFMYISNWCIYLAPNKSIRPEMIRRRSLLMYYPIIITVVSPHVDL